MMHILKALLFAAPPPTGLAPTGPKHPGVLWYGYSVRTGAADIRVDDVAQVAPPNSRTSRYTSAIAHGGALSRVEVALGTPHGSVVYYDNKPPAHLSAGFFHPSYQSGVPPLVPFPQGYVQPFGADGPPVPTQRFIGQVDHSQQPLPFSSLGPRIGTRAVPAVPFVASGVANGPAQQQPFSATVRITTRALTAAGEVEAGEVYSAQRKPPEEVVPFTNADHERLAVATPLSRPADERELEPSGTLPESGVQESISTHEHEDNVRQLSGRDSLSSSTAASVALQTSQSQDTSSVVKNHVKTPLVLNNGRGQYDFRGYEQFKGQPGVEDVPEAPEDSRTSKKHRHNFRREKAEPNKERKSNLEPVDSFDEEYDHDYEHDAGQRASKIPLPPNREDSSLSRSFVPITQDELPLTVRPDYQKPRESDLVTTSPGGSQDEKDLHENRGKGSESVSEETSTDDDVNHEESTEDGTNKHKSRVLSIALGEPATVMGAHHEQKIQRVISSKKNETPVSSGGAKPARVLNIYLNSVVKPSSEVVDTNETTATTAAPTEAPEEPVLRKDSLLGPSDLVLRPQFDLSAENARDLLATFTRSQKEQNKASQTSRNLFHTGTSSSTKTPIVRSVKKVKSENEEAEAVQKETVLLPSTTKVPSKSSLSFEKASIKTAEIISSSQETSLELSSSFCSSVRASVSVEGLTALNDKAKPSTSTPPISSSFSSTRSPTSTLTVTDVLDRSKSAAEAVPLYETPLQPTPTPKLTKMLSTRNFDNDEFPTCQNTCFWTLVRRSKPTSAVANVATSSPKGPAVSATSVMHVSSSTISGSDLLSPTLVNQTSARSSKGKRAKTEIDGRRSAGGRTQKASSPVSESRNKTLDLRSSLGAEDKSDQLSDLGTEESKANSSVTSLPSARNRPREANKRKSKQSTEHSSERLSSDPKLHNSLGANNDHINVQDEDAYLVDGDDSPHRRRNHSSPRTDVTGNQLLEQADVAAETPSGEPTKSQDDEDPSSREQQVFLPAAAVPIDSAGNGSLNSDVSDDELSVEGPAAPDPTNEATGPEFTRPMPLWPFLAPLLLLLFLPPAVWCLLRPEKLPPPPLPPPPPPPMPPSFHSWGRPSY
ncbi:hypothetical protein HPB49_001325 [Dermacentor silvarum]|uniref:Uncharacterized protein n=1 Tax=Dermacentor silvarum TaxID=543639 RepID=A0ACB8D212_DERSI|nr:hypothetical protein HPB49_001325 [Dermacentor silvarum]